MVPIFFYVACAVAAAGVALLLLPHGRGKRVGASVLGLAGLAWILVEIVGSVAPNAGELQPLGIVLLCGIVSIASAVRVITHHRPVFCALYFVLVVVSSAAIFVLLAAEFIAFALIIVYAGAILITYLFVLMLAQQSPAEIGSEDAVDYDRIPREPASAVMAGFVLIAVIGGSVFTVHDTSGTAALEQARSVRQGWRDLSLMPSLLLEQARRTDSTVTAMVRRPDGLFVTPQADHSAIVSVERTGKASPSDLTLPPSLLPDNTTRVGIALVTRFPVSLELAGVILLMAMLGAVVLARKQTDLAEDERRSIAGLSKLMDDPTPGASR